MYTPFEKASPYPTPSPPPLYTCSALHTCTLHTIRIIISDGDVCNSGSKCSGKHESHASTTKYDSRGCRAASQRKQQQQGASVDHALFNAVRMHRRLLWCWENLPPEAHKRPNVHKFNFSNFCSFPAKCLPTN